MKEDIIGETNIRLEEINNQFEEYQRRIVNEEKRLRFFNKVDVSDDFYNLIDDLCGTNLSKIKF